MTDVIDQANDQAEMIASAEASFRRAEGPAATGHCLNCGETLAAGLRWCDKECRDDWERRRR